MQVLYELVTVICKLRLSYHWETGKESHKRLSNQSGDLPFAVRERKVHATSNWQYERQRLWTDSAQSRRSVSFLYALVIEYGGFFVFAKNML